MQSGFLAVDFTLAAGYITFFKEAFAGNKLVLLLLNVNTSHAVVNSCWQCWMLL